MIEQQAQRAMNKNKSRPLRNAGILKALELPVCDTIQDCTKFSSMPTVRAFCGQVSQAL